MRIISSDSESARTYYHYVSDNQGSVRLILTDTTNDRKIRNYYYYDAFGESVISHEDIHNRFRFNGEQYDPVTSQYYLRARYYNPAIGRFTQEDTYYGDGLNLYEYCRNNPVLYRDPSGHDVCPAQLILYKKYITVGMTPQQAYNQMCLDLGIDLARGVGNNGFIGIYEKADYHGKKNNPVKSKAPNKGQEALDNSVSIGLNTTRRVGISDGEIVVFDETTNGVFHGHVRSWNELTDQMKQALRKAGMVNKKGKIIK